jgi:hypothetical protein
MDEDQLRRHKALLLREVQEQVNMTDVDQQAIDYEKLIRGAIWPVVLWCIIAIAAVGFPFTGWLLPSSERFASWFARAGAPVTIFALIAQTRVTRLADVLAPGHFGRTALNNLRDKYRWWKSAGNAVAIFMTIVGTVMWAYGDLFWNGR